MGRTYIIAEAGVNHNGSLAMAKQLVQAAARSGADAVKFQTFHAENVVSRSAPKATYQIQETGFAETQYEMIKKLELNKNEHIELYQECLKYGIEFISTPADVPSVDLLTELNVTRFKLSSADLTNAPLLFKVAKTGKPVIISTGMSCLGEIEMALGVLAFGYITNRNPSSIADFKEAYISASGQAAIRSHVSLLHCTTEYPVPYRDVNLRVIQTLRNAFELEIGLSDHTEGLVIPIAAVAYGATIIEKHFTLDKKLPGPDHSMSLDIKELNELVTGIRQVEEALGHGCKIPTSSDKENIMIVRKSLVAARNLEAGEIFTSENIATKRPGTGTSAMLFWDILGKKAKRSYKEDEVLDYDGSYI